MPVSRPNRRSLLRVAGIPVAGIVILIVLLAVNYFGNRYIPVSVEGGVYRGSMPGYGEIQVDLFLSHINPIGWFYREGTGRTEWFRMGRDLKVPNAWFGDFYDRTNGIIVFRLRDNEPRLQGVVYKKDDDGNNAALTFELKRIAGHFKVCSQSGLAIGRFGATKRYFGEFPSLPEETDFSAKLHALMGREFRTNGIQAVAGGIDHQWEALRLGWPQWMTDWRFFHEWHLRLQTERLASFMVYDSRNAGMNGNPTRWAGRNFWWHDGQLEEFQLPDLFASAMVWEPPIRRMCLEDLKKQGASLASGLSPAELDISHFTLSPTGLQIYFNPYEVGSGAEGEFVVHIPYEKLRDFLRADGPAALLPIQSR